MPWRWPDSLRLRWFAEDSDDRPTDPPRLTCAEALEAERSRLFPPESGQTPREHGAALCLSGGGVRSAAVCLGVMQALAAKGLLMAEPEIHQAVVFGDGQAGISALLVPADGQDARTVAAALARVNQNLSVIERIRRHALVPPFTVENGLLTPSQKIRRAAVLRTHREAVD